MSLLDSIFNLFSGNSANTDRKNTLAGYGDLSNVFNFGMKNSADQLTQGANTEKSALGTLAGPDKYFSDLLSGNRQQTLSAVAPTVNAANAQTDAQKKELASSGTSRGGGTNATSQQLDTAKMASIDNAIAGEKGKAAAGATGVAGVKAGIGATQLNTATNLLGLGEKAASSLTEESRLSRVDSQKLHDEKSKQAADVASGILDILFA